MANVFISYAREDLLFARRLYSALTGRGQEIWVDWRDIPVSAKWQAEIRGAIEACDVFLFVVTPASVASEMCRSEFTYAKRQRKRVVPILRESVESSNAVRGLSAIQWISLRDEDDFDTGVQALVSAVASDLPWIRTHARLLVRAREWMQNRDNDSKLLRGTDLAHAIRWLGKASVVGGREPTPLHAEFIEASQVGEAQERRRLEQLYATSLSRQLAAGALLARTEIDYRVPTTAATTLDMTATQGLKSNDALLSLERCLLLGAESIRRVMSLEADTALRAGFAVLRAPERVLPHPEFVGSVTYSADGRYLATNGWDSIARIYKTADWTEVGAVYCERLRNIAFSPDGRTLLAIGRFGGQAWSIRRRKSIVSFIGGEELYPSPDGRLVAVSDLVTETVHLFAIGASAASVALDQDIVEKGVVFDRVGDRLATAGRDRTVRLWNAATRQRIGTFPCSSSFKAMAFHPSGEILMILDGDGIDIWNVESGTRLAQLKDAAGADSLEISLDGRLVAVAGCAGAAARVWDCATYAEFRQLGTPHHSTQLSFAPDGRSLATWAVDRIVRLWDVKTGNTLGMMKHQESLYALCFSPDGRYIVTCGREAIVRVWPAIDERISKPIGERTAGVSAVAFGRDGKTMAVVGIEGSVDVCGGPSLKRRARLAHGEVAFDARFAPNGRHLAVSGKETVSVWDYLRRKKVCVTRCGPITSQIRFGEGGDSLIVASDFKELSMLRLPAGERIAGFEHPWRVTFFDVSANGRWLASGGSEDPTVLVWDLSNRSIATQITNAWDVGGVCFSHDGRLLATSGGEEIIIIDMETRQEVSRFGHDGNAYDPTFSPDATLLACTCTDGCVYVHDVTTRRRWRLVHSGVPRLAFNAKGAVLATVSSDQTARVWRVIDGKEVVRLPLDGPVSKVAFSPDDKWLITIGKGGARFHLWRRRDLVSEVCRRVTMNLNRSQWLEFLGDEPYRKTCPTLP